MREYLKERDAEYITSLISGIVSTDQTEKLMSMERFYLTDPHLFTKDNIVRLVEIVVNEEVEEKQIMSIAWKLSVLSEPMVSILMQCLIDGENVNYAPAMGKYIATIGYANLSKNFKRRVDKAKKEILQLIVIYAKNYNPNESMAMMNSTDLCSGMDRKNHKEFVKEIGQHFRDREQEYHETVQYKKAQAE